MENLDERYLLMIEPHSIGKPEEDPLEDDVTKKVDALFSLCQPSTYAYKGFHTTHCGKTSDNRDWILPNAVVTHSLASYYVRYYRPYIPLSEIRKIEKLYETLIIQKCV